MFAALLGRRAGGLATRVVGSISVMVVAAAAAAVVVVVVGRVVVGSKNLGASMEVGGGAAEFFNAKEANSWTSMPDVFNCLRSAIFFFITSNSLMECVVCRRKPSALVVGRNVQRRRKRVRRDGMTAMAVKMRC